MASAYDESLLRVIRVALQAYSAATKSLLQQQLSFLSPCTHHTCLKAIHPLVVQLRDILYPPISSQTFPVWRTSPLTVPGCIYLFLPLVLILPSAWVSILFLTRYSSLPPLANSSLQPAAVPEWPPSPATEHQSAVSHRGALDHQYLFHQL